MRRRRSNAPRDRCETGAVPAWRLTVPLVLAAGIFLHGHAESHAGAVAGPADAVGEAPAHDAAYWHAVIGNDFTPPDDAPLPALLWELNGYLSSTDPELRDDIAYGILTQWLYGRRIVPVELRRELVAVWRENLSKGIGETGTDSVFLRSFSALMLSVAVALDNEAPWLEEREFDRLLASALAYRRDERDTRGFDRDKGWIHSVAHTADLLKFLARSRHLEVSAQRRILTAIADKLARLDHVLAHGEDERLARAVVAIATRPDVDIPAFESFLQRLKPAPLHSLPTPEGIAANQNHRRAVTLVRTTELERRRAHFLGDRGSRLARPSPQGLREGVINSTPTRTRRRHPRPAPPTSPRTAH